MPKLERTKTSPQMPYKEMQINESYFCKGRFTYSKHEKHRKFSALLINNKFQKQYKNKENIFTAYITQMI